MMDFFKKHWLLVALILLALYLASKISAALSSLGKVALYAAGAAAVVAAAIVDLPALPIIVFVSIFVYVAHEVEGWFSSIWSIFTGSPAAGGAGSGAAAGAAASSVIQYNGPNSFSYPSDTTTDANGNVTLPPGYVFPNGSRTMSGGTDDSDNIGTSGDGGTNSLGYLAD